MLEVVINKLNIVCGELFEADQILLFGKIVEQLIALVEKNIDFWCSSVLSILKNIQTDRNIIKLLLKYNLS